jgi:hypothetical protein
VQIIAIAADDPKAASLNDVEDVERCAAAAVAAAAAAAAAWWPIISALHRRQCSVSNRATRRYRIACGACNVCCRVQRREMPGELEKIRVWFRDYKVPF